MLVRRLSVRCTQTNEIWRWYYTGNAIGWSCGAMQFPSKPTQLSKRALLANTKHLFLYVGALFEPSQPATRHVPAPPRGAVLEEKEHLDKAHFKVGKAAIPEVAPVPLPLLICGLKLVEGYRGGVFFCLLLF